MTMQSEFDLIRAYFTGLGATRADVALDIGDDCALLRPPAGHELAVSIDTLVADVHFFADCDPLALGYKALAVNLSDLAACGATPAWVTLALTVPQFDADWLRNFTRGFNDLAVEHGVRLIGGDTTRGPLTITVQVHGFVPIGQGLRRSGAKPGDLIVVSGSLGGAGLALRQLKLKRADPSAPPPLPVLLNRLERPIPRLALGQLLRGHASAAIDLSDGLAADVDHLLTASHCGAMIELAQLPLDQPVAAVIAATNEWELAVASGDDYELCFTLPLERLNQLTHYANMAACPLTVIGYVERQPGIRWHLPNGQSWQPQRSGYDHFNNNV